MGPKAGFRVLTAVFRVLTVAFIVAIALPFFLVNTVLAAGEVATYTAPDGFQVISYSRQWADINKLREVHKELLRNTHGEEFKLLRKVNIYPGADPQGADVSGRWYGVWKLDGTKPRLQGNRYIDIYNGDEFNTVPGIARTLAHEYGHHFTYYYYFKSENKVWDHWRTSGLAQARGLTYHPLVGAGSVDHKWLIQEISAEDYVQFFGSPTLKKSVDFPDLAERLEQGKLDISFSTDVYNFHPQENNEIPVAANLPALRDYWQRASGLTSGKVQAPTQVGVYLKEINLISGVDTPQYVFTWDQSSDDQVGGLDYTLVRFAGPRQRVEYAPVKTVSDGEALRAVFGLTGNTHAYMWEDLPTGVACFVVFVKDSDGLVTSSQVLAVDFSNPPDPQSVLIDDQSRSRGTWFPPRVKVNGKQVSYTVPPLVVNNRMMVPARDIFDELGISVAWDEQLQQVTATRGITRLVFRIGEDKADINGSIVTAESPFMMKDSKTMVPLSILGPAFGAEIRWNNNLQLASITLA